MRSGPGFSFSRWPWEGDFKGRRGTGHVHTKESETGEEKRKERWIGWSWLEWGQVGGRRERYSKWEKVLLFPEFGFTCSLLFPQSQLTSLTLSSSFPDGWNFPHFPQTPNDSFFSCPFTAIFLSLLWMSCDMAAPRPSIFSGFFSTQILWAPRK